MLRRFCVLLFVCVLGAVAVSAAGAGPPTTNKNALVLQADCGGTTYTAIVLGQGEFTPAHLVGATSVFIPLSFNITTTFTPSGGPTFTDTDTTSKAAPLSGVTCTIPFQSFSFPDGTFTIQGTVTGFFTPR